MSKASPLILGISGRKGSGKSTLAKTIKSKEGDRPIALFSLAEPVKDFAVDVLGLDYDLVNGDDVAKNTPTHLRWETFPVLAWRAADGRPLFGWPEAEWADGTVYIDGMMAEPRSGPMTVREVLQSYATEVFRKHDPDVFVRAAKRRIADWHDHLPDGVVIIDDVRFLNELRWLVTDGYPVVRLTRGAGGDSHQSEMELEGVVTPFDLVIENCDLTAAETLEQAKPLLAMHGIIS